MKGKIVRQDATIKIVRWDDGTLDVTLRKMHPDAYAWLHTMVTTNLAWVWPPDEADKPENLSV